MYYPNIAIRVKNSDIDNYISNQESSYIEENEIVQLYYWQQWNLSTCN